MAVDWIWVALLHVWVDVLLLMGTNKLAGYPPGWRKVLPAGSIDGVYAALCLKHGFSFLTNWWWRLIFLLLVVMAAFGLTGPAWKRYGMFVLLKMALGGIVSQSGDSNAGIVLLGTVIIWGLCHMAFGKNVGGRQFVPLEIRFGNSLLSLTALRDTGNMLRDPVTGEQVLVVDSDAGRTLTGLSAAQLSMPLENVGAVQGLRLVPFRTVGQANGFLLAKRYDSVRVGNWQGSAVVAFAPQAIGKGEGYRALTGGMTV